MTDGLMSARFNLGALMSQYNLKARRIAELMGRNPSTILRWSKKQSPPAGKFSRDVQMQLAGAVTTAAQEHGHEVNFTPDDLITYEINPDADKDVIKRQQLWKPGSWSVSDWVEWKRRYQREDGTFRCELTAKAWAAAGQDVVWERLPEANTFDHIKPRSEGGGDEMQNMQPAFKSVNSSRQDSADPWYQEPSLFFDAPITEEQRAAMRESQRTCGVDAIHKLADLWLTERFKVSGNLFMQNMIVRSGKFLTGAVVIPRAINEVIRQHHGDEAKRIKTVLVLTKEKALQDQFVAEAKSEPAKYRISDTNPRVLALDSGDGMARRVRIEPALIRRDYDLAIGCLQTFYTENGVPKEGVAEMLRAYDLIVIDEPQFAEDQWKALLRHTSDALVIGMTGTPLQPTARISRRTVEEADGTKRVAESYEISCLKGDERGGLYGLSSWTADDSDRHDHNLKHIPHDAADRDALVINAGDDGFSSDVIQQGGQESTLTNEGNLKDRVHYGSVVGRHAIWGPGGLWTRDRFWRARDTAVGPLGKMTPIRQTQERDGRGYSPELLYPPHLILVGRGIHGCERVASILQAQMDADPSMRRSDGWCVEVCHSGNLNYAKNRLRREELLQGVNLDDAAAVAEVNAKLASERIYAPKPLTIPADPQAEPDKVHPFMRGWLVHRGKAMDEKCARVLVVDGMVKEGLNNPLILGVAQGAKVSLAIVELIQRMARSLAAFIDTENMLCCPAELDEPFFVTHALFDVIKDEDSDDTVDEAALEDDLVDRSTAAMMRLALNYLRNAEKYTEEIPPATKLLEGLTFDDPASLDDPNAGLTHIHKVEVVKAVGKVREETGVDIDAPIDPGPVVERVRKSLRGLPAKTIDKAIDLGTEISQNPPKVRTTDVVFRRPQFIGPVVMSEKTSTSAADPLQTMVAHAYTHMLGEVEKLREIGLELSELLAEGDRTTTQIVKGNLEEYQRRHGRFQRTGSAHQPLNALINQIHWDARKGLGISQEWDTTLKSVVLAVKPPKPTKSGRPSRAKPVQVTGLSRMHELTHSTLKKMLGCPQRHEIGGKNCGWNNGGKWDDPAVHDLVQSNYGAVVQAVERAWLESLPVDIPPLTDVRAGMGITVKTVAPTPPEEALDF